MKRILLLAVAAVLSMSVSACQDNTSPGAVLAGTYTLRSVNNHSVPVIIDGDPDGITEVVGGYIRIDRNGNYTDVATLRYTPTGGVPGQPYDDVINGTWALSGDQLQLTDVTDPYNPYYMTVSGNNLIYNDYASGTSYTIVYSK